MSLEVDDSFQCNLLIIRVENRIFRAPRELFELYSEVFKDMFSLPTLDDSQADGERDSKPLYLEGISKDDFHAFLTVLSSLHYESVTKGVMKPGKATFIVAKFPLYDGLDKQRWVAVLRLSHMWSFDQVHTKAIEVLDNDCTLDVLERLQLAHEFLIRHWVRPAYRLLLTRDEALTEAEIPWLGPQFVASMTKAREERIKLFLLRVIGGEVPIPNCCLKCGRLGAMRVTFTKLDTTVISTPTLRCLFSCPGGDFTLEQVLRDSKNLRSKAPSSVIDGDLDRLIDRFLPAI